MNDQNPIQWFPGHMTKTRRLMEKNIGLVDLVTELADARIPYSSRNPEVPRLTHGKPRILLLNKCDAADEAATRLWLAHYKAEGTLCLATDCRSGKGLGQYQNLVRSVLAEKIERLRAKGMGGRAIRVMVVGIPNTGKSSFINRMAGGKRAKVEDRPGVTRGKQWVSLADGIDLLDMPGVLWPKFDDQTVAEHLAFTGAIKDDVLDIETLAVRLLDSLARHYPDLLAARYGVEAEGAHPGELLEAIGRKRGMLISGGEVNTERAAIMLLDEFRGGRIGRITLERPGEMETRMEEPDGSLRI